MSHPEHDCDCQHDHVQPNSENDAALELFAWLRNGFAVIGVLVVILGTIAGLFEAHPWTTGITFVSLYYAGVAKFFWDAFHPESWLNCLPMKIFAVTCGLLPFFAFTIFYFDVHI